jgi:Uma2 family endonuclease
MGHPAKKRERTVYADFQAVPDTKVAEVIKGTLHVMPRPAIPHAWTASQMHIELGGSFRRGGPIGGWHILVEPEIHFGLEGQEDILVPDLAGWRVARMPKLPKTAYISLAPDWVCEVLSPSTAATDRAEKLPIYARERVGHVWFVHPTERVVEIFELGTNGRWIVEGIHRGNERIRAKPFEEVELDLSVLWIDDEDPNEPTPEQDPTPPPISRSKKIRDKAAKLAKK